MSMLLAPHLTHITAAGYSDRTVGARTAVLQAADKKLPHGIDTPTTEELAAYLATPNWSRWTLCTYFHHLTGFYRWATSGHNPHLSWDPSADLIAPHTPTDTPHPVTDDELHQAVTRSDDSWRDIIYLAAYAGLRVTEICRLRREDITTEQIMITHGKGDKSATIPTHPEVWQRFGDRPGGILVPGFGPSRRPAQYMSSRARSHFNRIGMPDVHLHRFRHWYATSLLRNGADIRTVQSLMRHGSLQTTARYLEIGDEQRRLAVNTLPVPRNPLQDAA